MKTSRNRSPSRRLLREGAGALLAFLIPWAGQAVQNTDDEAAHYMPVAQQYLTALSEDRLEDALALVDFRGMADYLIDRRIKELRQGNPTLTAEEEAVIVKGFREKEVSNERLRDVILDLLREQNAAGMTWTFKQTARPEKFPNAVIVTYEMIKPGSPAKKVPLGLQKVGPKWYIAPDLMERVLAPVKAETIQPSQELLQFGDAYWELWRNGEMDAAYDAFSPLMQQKVTLINYLESTRKVIDEFGVLLNWNLFNAHKLPHDQIGLVYDLDFSKKKGRSLITIQQTNSAWKITGFQFQNAPAPSPMNRPASDRPNRAPTATDDAVTTPNGE